MGNLANNLNRFTKFNLRKFFDLVVFKYQMIINRVQPFKIYINNKPTQRQNARIMQKLPFDTVSFAGKKEQQLIGKYNQNKVVKRLIEKPKANIPAKAPIIDTGTAKIGIIVAVPTILVALLTLSFVI